MFNAFRQRPDEFINSPIIKNGSIDLFTPSKEIADKVRNYRDRYYNPSDVEELFNKYGKQKINENNNDRNSVKIDKNKKVNKNEKSKCCF